MYTEQEPHIELSGILEKRRQNVKFQWRTYSFSLAGMKLSYYKVGGSNDKEVGEMWGAIDMRELQSVNITNPVGSRYPIEVTLRSGKVILLASDSYSERARWMKALQDKMLLSKRRRSSEGLLGRDKPTDLVRGTYGWRSQPGTSSSETENPKSNKELGASEDMDSFIDQTFNGITFNRQSQMLKNETRRPLPDLASLRKLS